MSVLNQQQQLDEARLSSRRVKKIAANMADNLLTQWHDGWDSIWLSSDPSSVLLELGTDAAEIFSLNEDVITFLVAALSGKMQEELDFVLTKVANKPATTTHPDGSVTID